MLLVLPDDLLHAILLQVDAESVSFCQATCRRLKTLVENSMQFQYKMELGAAPMCEGLAARNLNVSEKLQRIRSYRAACTRDIKFEELPFAPALTGDTLLHSSVTTLVSDSIESDGRRVYVQQMPSVLRGIEERHWSIKLEAFHSFLAVDASQDLLIVQKTT
ncbi:hypothetical protein FA95DRAFT_713871 [Auriscalpium vulgare]|uniref:Uncharacterized protein n=1 Tax=Auriscalpium vulgare TaxID=40419 RepID=A0ACB8RB35_9AGAM|nr:hypothetical protein FA95DRAFT_713871 [Auriscalpium vulgare]